MAEVAESDQTDVGKRRTYSELSHEQWLSGYAFLVENRRDISFEHNVDETNWLALLGATPAQIDAFEAALSGR